MGTWKLEDGVDSIEITIMKEGNDTWELNGLNGRRNLKGWAWPGDNDTIVGCIYELVGGEIVAGPRFLEGRFEVSASDQCLHLTWWNEEAVEVKTSYCLIFTP